MKRIVQGLLAAGTAALALHASPARADQYHRTMPIEAGRYQPPQESQGRGGGDRPRGYDWREARRRELEREREAFYARWNGNRWARARFERDHARRCHELERRGPWRG